MKKVKGFRLELRPKEVLRLAKKEGLDLGPLGGPDGLPVQLAQAAPLLSPAIVYDSFPGVKSGAPGPGTEGLAARTLGLAPIPGVAFSLILATLGDGLASRRRGFQESEPARCRLWELIARCALNEAVRFAAGLIESEAALENCELSPSSPLSGNDALASVLDCLDCAKIGVSLGDSGLIPSDSSALSLSWLSKSRSKKSK
ncbi:MAG: hypothetical protein HY927_17230 [Elusimicrobia bacterium]|nr:hypothetical protein [Elusimicrobiota bacterium]